MCGVCVCNDYTLNFGQYCEDCVVSELTEANFNLYYSYRKLTVGWRILILEFVK